MPNLANKQVPQGSVTNTPWAEAAPHISNLMGSASDLMQAGQMAPPSSLLQSAGSGLEGYTSGANINGGSPQFNQALNYQSGQLTDDINRGFSLGGRYGSGAHVGALGDTVGQFRNNALQGEMSRQQGLQMTGIGMAPGIAQAQQLEPWNVLNAGNQIIGPYGQMFGTQTQMGRRGLPVLRALGGLAATALGGFNWGPGAP